LGVTPQEVPYGGNTFSCSAFSLAGTTQFQINNPKKGTFTIPGTSYSITLNNVTKTSTDWSADGGITIFDLGINGGSMTAWYKYRSGVTADTGVHGTLQSPGNLYGLSYMTFCYTAPTASIAGSVFSDTNASGTQESGEGGVAARSVRLFNSGGTQIGSTTTAANGSYAFSNLPLNGTFKVCLVAAAGYTQTSPTSGASCSTANGERPFGRSVTLGSSATGLDFGEAPAATITASVFHDKDKSGTLNGGDAALIGWRVFLDLGSPGNGTFDSGEPTGQTGANGSFAFSAVPGASYRICEELLSSDWFASTPVCTSVGPLVGGTNTAAAFGNYQKATITASTYWDKDGLGSFSVGTDVAQSGWTVFVDRNGNNVLDGGDDSGLTDEAGTRQFSVDPGTYNVCEVVQGGWTNTDPGGATACKSTGALPSQGTGSPAFGNNQKASISGQIFNDNDVNHQFGSGDTALPTTVTLYAGGVPVMSKPTNSDGTYTFAGLNTGFGYTVCAVAPAGDWTWLQTAPGAGATNCSALEFTNPAVVVNLTANTGSVDIGAQKQASIRATVFNDADNDGALGNGEGVPGWTVHLYKDGSSSVFLSTTSGPDGAYSFTSLPAASTYRVCVVPPNGTWTQTRPTSSSVACGAGEFPMGYGYSPLDMNRVNVTNFGGVVLADVAGNVFYDTNQNQSKDNDEDGLPWSVKLYRGTTVYRTTAAGTGGGFQFTGVPVGNYRVCVVPGDGRWKQTTPAADPNAVCGAAELPRGVAVALTASGKSNADFGNVQIANISGSVFIDSTDHDGNFDGVKQASESWYSGATVNLYTSAGASKGTATTDQNGVYTFADKEAGNYVVCLGAVDLYGLVKPTAGDPLDQAHFPATPGSVGCLPATGNFSQAYGLTLGASDATGFQFAVVAGKIVCSIPFPSDRYLVKLANGVCKEGQIFTWNYDDTGNKLAEITPVRHDLPPVPMVEKILWSIPSDKHQLKIIYDDIPPYSRAQAQDMAFCLIDPRNHTLPDDGISLLPAYWPMTSQGSILPPGQTSCLIEVKALVAPPTGGLSDYAFYIYSSVDGWRSTP
jgi:hypothetical protein